MAAVLAKGTTTLYNAACEPYLQQLCLMLNRMGAKISGVGSNLLTIEGVEKLHGTDHTVLPDMIENRKLHRIGGNDPVGDYDQKLPRRYAGHDPGGFQETGDRTGDPQRRYLHSRAGALRDREFLLTGRFLRLPMRPWPWLYT